MPRSDTLHGAAPDTHISAVLVIDLLSDFAFEDGERLARASARIAPRVAHLCARARRAHAPVVYINDHHQRWRSDRTAYLAHCLNPNSRGRRIVERLAPQPRDYFIFKPKHSGFYATPLEELLRHLGTQRLILTGTTLEQCVLFTAIDGYVRDYDLAIPPDCVTGLALRECTLRHMEELLHAQLSRSAQLRFDRQRRRN